MRPADHGCFCFAWSPIGSGASGKTCLSAAAAGEAARPRPRAIKGRPRVISDGSATSPLLLFWVCWITNTRTHH
ncbi:hypothetical protein GQ55_6G263400 [Panicum hallii var. hallii]|uniref:Uncharacterized protein n=1 Tax=Panicum hallii var. hallii TaxID=1504633 RepID=A0A2T7D9V7_9POAL|nr:hypothetical protein GQ55_6G263400 [Panicum hallii var. hallii]